MKPRLNLRSTTIAALLVVAFAHAPQVHAADADAPSKLRDNATANASITAASARASNASTASSATKASSPTPASNASTASNATMASSPTTSDAPIARDAAAFGRRLADVVATHPDVQGARKQADAAQLGIDAARAGYFPRVTVGSTLGRDSVSEGSASASVDRRDVELNLRQNLYTGGKLSAETDLATADQSIAQAGAQQTAQRIALEAMSAHLQVARARLLLMVARSSQTATEQLLKLETRREQLGGGNMTDAEFAQTRLALAQERTHQYETALDEALNTYRQLYLAEPDEDGPLIDLVAPHARLERGLEGSIADALAFNPEARLAELQRKKAEHAVELADAQNWPTVEVVASRRLGHDSSDVGSSTNSSVGLRVAYSLYSGGEIKARIGSAEAQRDAQAQAAVAIRRRVEENVRSLWKRWTGADQRVRLLEGAAGDALRVFLNRRRLREFGRETAVAVLDAQLEYNNVLISLVNVGYDGRLASLRLMNAVGALAPERDALSWYAGFVDTTNAGETLRRRLLDAESTAEPPKGLSQAMSPSLNRVMGKTKSDDEHAPSIPDAATLMRQVSTLAR